MKLQNNLYHIKECFIESNEASFIVTFLSGSEIYKAHFPGLPITPGVCIIQLVKELFEEVIGHSLEIKFLKNVKFLSVIKPSNSNINVSLSKITEIDNGWSFQAIVKDEVTVYAKLSVQTTVA